MGAYAPPRPVLGRHWMGRRILAHKTLNGKGIIIRVKKVPVWYPGTGTWENAWPIIRAYLCS